jgi:site-specific DNA recombinase
MMKTPAFQPPDYSISISSSTMRIAIYARKSTESEDRQVQSLDDQLRILRDIADRDKFKVIEVITESKSAKEPGKRPGFQNLLQLIESGQIEGILTWHINRLTRNLVDGGFLAHALSSGKLQMILTPERTFRSEDNVLLLAIENGVATSYIHDLSKAVRRGMDSKACKGWKPGQAPMGYINDWESREIKLDPLRGPMVRRAFEMLMSGSHSVAEIWRELMQLGLTGKSKSRRGKTVSRVAVHNMLRNPFYAGRLQYKGELLQGAHQPIVSPGEFELAQLRLKRLSNPKHRTNHPPAFSGVFTCKTCGAAVVHEQKRKRLAGSGNEVTYSYYHCSGSRGCKRLSVAEQPVSELARVFVDRLAISRSFADWCYTAVQNACLKEQTQADGSVSALIDALNVDVRRLDSLTMKFVDGDIGREAYQRTKSQLETAILERRSTLKGLEDRDSIVLSHIKQKLDAAVKARDYAIGDQNLRRTVLTSLGAGHVLDGKEVKFRADPILQKIASFEPGARSSQSPKSDDFVPDDQVWWSLVDDIRTETSRRILAEKQEKNDHCKRESDLNPLPPSASQVFGINPLRTPFANDSRSESLLN